MEQYWTQYQGGTTTVSDNTWPGDDSGTTIIAPWEYYPGWYCSYPHENKTEKAYEILKVLVKEKVIDEPKSFKKFCDLIEKIAKAI